jgi:hypothetical protein
MLGLLDRADALFVGPVKVDSAVGLMVSYT